MAGNIPIKDDITLTRGADFVARYDIHTNDPDIPAGTTARIEVTATNATDAPIVATWTAVNVSTRHIEFRTESEAADLIPARHRYRLIVSFPDTPTLEHAWYAGQIKRVQ